MKTQAVLNTGIDRNFLRKCIEEKIIEPKKLDNEWIIDKNYIPNDYSQKDVETVWNAYLCRKMGISYTQIKALTEGQKVSLRGSMDVLIQKYESQIEELKAVIEFMKYVKGLGFVPNLTEHVMGSDNFINYITDYLYHLDKDKKLKRALVLVEYASKISEVSSDEPEHIEAMLEEANSLCGEEYGEAYSSALYKLVGKTHLSPSSKEAQSIIEEVFYYYKKINNIETISARAFALAYIEVLSYDSDISVALKNFLGEKAFNFLIKALEEFG